MDKNLTRFTKAHEGFNTTLPGDTVLDVFSSGGEDRTIKTESGTVIDYGTRIKQ